MTVRQLGRAGGAHRSRWAVLAVVCLVRLVVVLDNTVLNVALPELGRELGAGTVTLQWIVTAYSLAQAGLLLAAGAAADRYGRRRMLLGGLLLFGLGSLAAGLSGAGWQLIAARATGAARTSQLLGSATVLTGGIVTALLLRRAAGSGQADDACPA